MLTSNQRIITMSPQAIRVFRVVSILLFMMMFNINVHRLEKNKASKATQSPGLFLYWTR